MDEQKAEQSPLEVFPLEVDETLSNLCVQNAPDVWRSVLEGTLQQDLLVAPFGRGLVEGLELLNPHLVAWRLLDGLFQCVLEDVAQVGALERIHEEIGLTPTWRVKCAISSDDGIQDRPRVDIWAARGDCGEVLLRALFITFE